MSPTNPSAFPFKNGDRVHHDGDPLVDKTQVYKSCPARRTWTERQVLRKSSHPSPPQLSVALCWFHAPPWKHGGILRVRERCLVCMLWTWLGDNWRAAEVLGRGGCSKDAQRLWRVGSYEQGLGSSSGLEQLLALWSNALGFFVVVFVLFCFDVDFRSSLNLVSLGSLFLVGGGVFVRACFLTSKAGLQPRLEV